MFPQSRLSKALWRALPLAVFVVNIMRVIALQCFEMESSYVPRTPT